MWSCRVVCASACVVLLAVLVASEGVERCARHKRDIMMPIYNEPSSFFDNGRQVRRHIPAHHSYHHNHNHPNLGDFPWGRGHEIDNTPHQSDIPNDLMKRLNEVETLEDFMKHVRMKSPEIENRFGEIDSQNPDRHSNVPINTSGIPMADPARCKLEEATVSLHIPNHNTNHMYFPTCTRVMRCGGCCTNTITSCQASRSENLTMHVMVTEYQGDNQMMTFLKKEEVQVENHTECRCSCTIKAEHCKPLQTYIPGECRCACTNMDERQKCEQENDTKVWDHNTCFCSCREERPCSTGSVFNSNTCRCMRIPRRRATNGVDKRLRRENEQPSFHPRPVVPHPSSNDQQEN